MGRTVVLLRGTHGRTTPWGARSAAGATQYRSDLSEVIAAVKAGKIERLKTASKGLGVYMRS